MKKKQNVNCKNPSRNYLGLLINQFSVHLFATYANSRRIFIFFFFCALKMPLQQIKRGKERNGLHRYNSDAQVWNFQNRFGQLEYALRLSKFVCEVGFPHIYGNLNFHHKQSSKCFLYVYLPRRIPRIKRITHGRSLYGLLLTAISIYSQFCQFAHGNQPLQKREGNEFLVPIVTQSPRGLCEVNSAQFPSR